MNLPGIARPVYGAIHMTMNRLFGRDQAHYRAPCSMPGCNNPHERKCDFILHVSLVNGVRRTQNCNKVLCRGCAATYHQVDYANTIDFCPEHDKVMLDRMTGK